MKRFYGTLGTGMVLVWGLVWLMTWTPTVQAQTDPNAPAAPNAVYLPLIAGGTGTSHIKSKSGIHLGNRGSDWPDEFFGHLLGTPAGVWPAAFGVRSTHLFELIR